MRKGNLDYYRRIQLDCIMKRYNCTAVKAIISLNNKNYLHTK